MFNFRFDKRILYVIIGIMVAKTLVQYATVEGALLSLVLSIPGVLIAITFHEFAHAFVADKLGDDTPRKQKRLNLNPLSHLDPIGSVLLLFAGFGWGKPVEVNPRNYNRKRSMEKSDALVSIAGPVMNFILAIVFIIIICVVIKATDSRIFMVDNGLFYYATNQTIEIVIRILLATVLVNIGLGIFNLIPLPPLDGSKVIMPFLPANAKTFFKNNEMIFYIIFVALWFTGIAGMIISPIIDFIGTGLFKIILPIFGF